MRGLFVIFAVCACLGAVELQAAGDAAAGEKLFNSILIGCSGCHSTGDEKIVGPGLAGIYERAATRTDLDADAYITESLRDPQAFVVPDFPGVMRTFDQLSDGDVNDLIAFLKTLK